MPSADDRRALITGADGFVGGYLRAHLRDQGWHVRAATGAATNAPDARRRDIADAGQVADLLAWAAPVTHVYHLAAVTFVPEAITSPIRATEVNLAGTMRLIRATRDACPNARFLYVSSSEVYGPPQRLPVTETHPLEPANPYAITKAAADQYCRFVHKNDGMDIVVARPFNHSGPGQSGQFALSSFARQIAEMEAGSREPVLRVGNLEAARDFSHVADVVRAYEVLALEGEPGEAYNVCSGTAYRLQDAVNRLRKMARTEVTIEVDPARLRKVDVPEIRGSYKKLVKATGWRPRFGLDDILEGLLDYWRQHLAATQ